MGNIMIFERCPDCGGNMELIDWQNGLWLCPLCGLMIKR